MFVTGSIVAVERSIKKSYAVGQSKLNWSNLLGPDGWAYFLAGLIRSLLPDKDSNRCPPSIRSSHLTTRPETDPIKMFQRNSKKMGQFRPLFLFIFVISTCYNLNSYWKKHRWCAWDSNPGWQDGRIEQIHWATNNCELFTAGTATYQSSISWYLVVEVVLKSFSRSERHNKDQCDQMARWFVPHLAICSHVNLPNSINIFQSEFIIVQNATWYAHNNCQTL